MSKPWESPGFSRGGAVNVLLIIAYAISMLVAYVF